MAQEKHPKGLYVLFFTEMWERFGFYSMLAMFVLYLRDYQQGFGWSADSAKALYANYLMFVYASPLIGGWIADKGLGYRNSVMIGGVIFMVGYFLLSGEVPTFVGEPVVFFNPSETLLYAALTCLVIGNGFFKPNVSAMVGHLYPEGSALKDRAFTIFYMGINIGALLAPINAEFMKSAYGFRPAFAIAAFGMVISVAILWAFKRHVEPPSASPEPAAPQPPDPEEAAVTADVPPAPSPPLNPIDQLPDRQRVAALLVIFVIAIVFWMVFHQNGSTLTEWADGNTSWKVSGIISNAINPAWVVTLAFPMVWFWGWLASKGMEPSIPAKMGVGMVLTTLSFTILYTAAKVGESTDVRPEMFATADFRINDRTLDQMQADGVPEDILQKLRSKDEKGNYVIQDKKFATDEKSSGERKLEDALRPIIGEESLSKYRPAILQRAYLFKMSPLWLIVAYGVMTMGELMLSPMGLSLVSKVAPIRIRGLMMGGWFVATAIGNKLTQIGVYYDRWDQSTFFAVLGLMALVVAILLFGLVKPLKKAMPGV